MRVRFLASAALALSAAASSVSAQNNSVALAPISNWNYQHHASTYEEGYMQGAAGVLQAAGQANYANSLAAVNFQEAYRRQLENSRLYVQVFLERREMVRQYLDRYGDHPPTKEQLERIAKAALPDRLTADEYELSSGKLVWPHILRDDAYTAFRKKIDELMASRTPENSGDGSLWQRELHQKIDGMKRVLKQNIDTVTAQQYARAKWFLVSLDYEGTLPLTHDGAQPEKTPEKTQPEVTEAATAPAPAPSDVPAPTATAVPVPPAPPSPPAFTPVTAGGDAASTAETHQLLLSRKNRVGSSVKLDELRFVEHKFFGRGF